ncbi:atp-dependent zinc metalloprotease ftsh 12, partial [Quercus suber]
MALLRGILILWPIRESVLLLHIISKRFLYKKYDQLFVTWLMQKIQAEFTDIEKSGAARINEMFSIARRN